MALAINAPNDIVSSNPTVGLRGALQDFEAALDTQQLKLFNDNSSAPTPESVNLFIADVAAKNQNSKGRSLWGRLYPVLEATRQFTSIINQFVSSNPRIAALVWGGTLTALLVISNATSYSDHITALVKQIGDLSPTFAEFGHLYTHHIGVQSALCQYYTIVVRIWTKVVVSWQKSVTSHLLASVFNPFPIDFKPLLEDLSRAKTKLTIQVDLAGKQAVQEMHQLVKYDAHQRAEHHRWSIRFGQDLQADRESASKWREKQIQMRMAETRTRIKESLSNINYRTAWRMALQSRVAGTAEWFGQDQAFQQWQSDIGSALLWCRGTIGAGKTVFTSNVVAHLLPPVGSPKNIVAYHFCRSDHEASLQARAIIGTLARQILDVFIQEMDQDTLETLLNRSNDLDTEDVVQLLASQLKLSNVYYLIIDGLDECAGQEAKEAQRAVANLCSRHHGPIKIYISARPDLEMYQFGWGIPQHLLVLSKTNVQEDIERYIDITLERCLMDGDLKTRDLLLRAKIVEILKAGADGMFLWARLFISELCACPTDHEISEALKYPPRGLSELLDRILKRIDSQTTAEQAICTLRYCGVAKRPLLIAELQEVLSILEGQQWLERDRMPLDMKKVISSCCSLLFIDDIDESVHYIHHSLKVHFFARNNDQEANEKSHTEYADIRLGVSCLVYLSFSDFRRTVARRPAGLMTKFQPMQFAESALTSSKVGAWKSYRKLGRDSANQAFTVQELARKVEDVRIEQGSASPQDKMHAQGYHFLDYAQHYWIYHLQHYNKNENLKTWNLFLNLIHRKDSPALKPWEIVHEQQLKGQLSLMAQTSSQLATIQWAVHNNHTALLNALLSYKSTLIQEELERLFVWTIAHPSLYRVSRIIFEALETRILARPLILLAIEHENEHAVSLLLQSDQFTAVDLDAFGRIAVEKGLFKIVSVLLATGLSANSYPKIDTAPSLIEIASDKGYTEIALMLIEAGADVNQCRSGRSALYRAAAQGDLEMLNLLLIAGASVDSCTTISGLLTEGARSGSVDVVVRLLVAGAGIVRPGLLSQPLLAAVEHNDIDIIKVLVAEGADLNEDSTSDTPLIAAIRLGNQRMAKQLLELGADINFRGGSRRSPFAVAVMTEMPFDFLSDMVSAGAKVDAYTRHGTVLTYVIYKQAFEMVAQLISLGADVNLITLTQSPLCAAIEKDSISTTIALLLVGADPNLAPLSSDPPIVLAQKLGRSEHIKALEMAGADLNKPYFPNVTLTVASAASRGDLDTVKRLVEAGADIHLDRGFGTPLTQAARNGWQEVVEYLVSKGADDTAAGEELMTAMSDAFNNGHKTPGLFLHEELVSRGIRPDPHKVAEDDTATKSNTSTHATEDDQDESY